MEELTKFTPTELLKMINDLNVKHQALKKEIVDHTIEVDEIEKKINEKLENLTDIEKNYVLLIEEIERRK